MAETTAHLRDLAPPPALVAVEAWLARRPAPASLTWCAFADPDGAIGLVPSGVDGGACPALLLTEQADGYGVIACDPDDPVEIGVFATIEDALRDISHWMTPATSEPRAP